MRLELFWQRQVIVVEFSYLDDVYEVVKFGQHGWVFIYLSVLPMTAIISVFSRVQ